MIFNKSIYLHKYWWNRSNIPNGRVSPLPPNFEFGINVLSLYRSSWTKWNYFCCENLLNSTHSPSWLWVWMYFLCTDLDVSYHTHCIIYSCLCMNEWVKLKQSGVRYKLLRMEHINCSRCHNIRKLGIGKIFEHHNGIRLINNSVCAPFVIEQQRWLDSCTIQIFVWIE